MTQSLQQHLQQLFPDYVMLPGSQWYLKLNPEGGGLMLCVPRGISCEGHTQVVSCHTTNTPGMDTVRDVVKEMEASIKKQIDAFVTLMQSMQNAWEVKEAIGLIFEHNLVRTIAEAAEKKEFS